MSLELAWPLVLFLIFLVLWFAWTEGQKIITAIFYCAGAVWFMAQLFLAFRSR